MPETTSFPVCAWVGMSEDGEHEITCGRPARFLITAPDGHKVHACGEHIGELHAQLPEGSVVHDTEAVEEEGRRQVSPGEAIRWE